MLQENFPDLQKLYGQGALSGYLGGQQIDAARKSQQINQQGALQDMFWKDQTTPVDMQYKQALTGQTNETARGQKFKNDFNDTYKDDVYKREVKRLAKEMNEDDLKSADAQIQKMLYDDSPQVRGIAQMLLSNTKDIIAEREKQKYMLDRQAALEEQRGKNQVAAKAAGATAPTKALTMQQYEAMLRQKAAEGDQMAIQSLAQLEEDKRRKAAAGALIQDKRVRELLGYDDAATDTSSTGKAKEAPKKAPTNAQEAQAAGWKIMTDKNGKKAYVSPDKTQFFEVQ